MNNNGQASNKSAPTPANPTVILVTGGLGYLGSQLIRSLAALDACGPVTIRILDNLQGGHYPALMDLPGSARYQFVEGDILDPATVKMALQGVDIVVHLAAIVRTPMSFEQPRWVEQVNHWGTSHLLEYCLEAGVRRFIYTSSAAVYGPGGPYSEGDRCRPQGAYAQSKYLAELALEAARERGLNTTILRLGTIYGLAPVTRFEAVANRFAYLAGVGRPLTLYGEGRQRRALVHVSDAVQAINFCLAHPDQTGGRVFNVVAGNVAVLELIEIIQAIKPETSVRFTEQDIRTHLSFEVDSSALVAIGWQPAVTWQAGLTELIDRFQHFMAPTPVIIDFEE